MLIQFPIIHKHFDEGRDKEIIVIYEYENKDGVSLKVER